MTDTTHITLYWSDDTEVWVIIGAPPGDAEPDQGSFEADIPTELYNQLEEAWDVVDKATAAIVALAGVEEGRKSTPCDTWTGDTIADRRWWEITLASISEHEWPTRDTTIGRHYDTEAAARADLDGLPDEFVVISGVSIAAITKDRLTIRNTGYRGYHLPCETCGCDHDDHTTANEAVR